MGDYSAEIISRIDRNYIADLLAQGERIDGRAYDEFRPIEIEYDVVSAKAEGSALVRMGGTSVIAGVKVLLGEPYPDTPDEGVIMVTAEMPPLASPLFELGPPREDAIELARVVDRGVRESETVEVKKLCVEPGKVVQMVFCDVYALEFDGNLIDCASIAANAALLTTEFPEHKWENGEAVPTGNKISVPLKNLAVEATVAKIEDHLIIDPVLKEEMVQDCRITMAVDEGENFTAIQKGGGAGPMTLEQVDQAFGMALDGTRMIRELIRSTAKERE
ncbi:MAG: exosome complex protein Rrp42 [Candidatus Thorarchaeota archaeon]|nr:MAG: exosome complex protein Rrp42 [Candidatus Thorarchaeota archaeon]